MYEQNKIFILQNWSFLLPDKCNTETSCFTKKNLIYNLQTHNESFIKWMFCVLLDVITLVVGGRKHKISNSLIF